MKNSLQIGDVVRISESSPLMTIIGLGERPIPIDRDILMPQSLELNEAECIWWDSNKNDFCDAVFPMECLQLVNHNVIITTFQIGDVVQLASGGLKMTISYLGGSHSTHNELDVLQPLTIDPNEVECNWWDNNKNDFASKVFPIQCLQLINHNVVSTTFQIGDVVQLASGSPDFQVMSIDNDDLSLIEVQHPEKPCKEYNKFILK